VFHQEPGPTGILIQKKEKVMAKTSINKVYKDMAGGIKMPTQSLLEECE
jgi:hypothetical protein